MSNADVPDVPDVGELLDLIERLDADNERLRLRVLDVMAWMEDAVTAQVATERQLAACEQRASELAAELDAIERTKSWRLLAGPRGLYAAARRNLSRRRR